jgi:hypothetical protein
MLAVVSVASAVLITVAQNTKPNAARHEPAESQKG